MMATVELTVWLRRVGGRTVRHPLPHQSQRAIRALVWADDVENLHLRVFGHLLLPTSHVDWRPQLMLETAEPGPVLTAALETQAGVLDKVDEARMRPYSLRFDLPEGTETETCFKLVESSYPGHKVPVCIPHEDFKLDSSGAGVGGSSGRSHVCESLAPAGGTNASAPALWAVVGPPRHVSSSRRWRSHYGQVAMRTAHFLSYHTAMGVSGLLLYTDAAARFYLRKHAALAPYLQSGQLRLITWDMPERGHPADEPHRRGGIRSIHGARPLGYNYDQALFASHALLGLSACGANLILLVTDMDEYLHMPSVGQPWPAPLADCLARTSASRSGQTVTARSLPRIPVLSSQAAGGQGGGRGSAGAVGSSEALRTHPLTLYDQRASRILMGEHGKMLVMPAAEVVAFFVHEGVPRHGAVAVVDSHCMALLHVTNFWRPRENGTSPATQHSRFGASRSSSAYVPFSWEGSPLAGLMGEAAAAFRRGT
ncbi:hypothetical protein GPECTOR_1g498 [Gonium pectorale]|uniref:Glycosyltransferase family 92 protein n=1 Tax=Gonium pectorale TaxID=33097 RepID=A0A150H3D1_GONPE|nr:hypothetical protein GPECTOR_1g498 [Gonium pectorale]|eukprot:KXZ56554.1 hypothetical protein GPECTOR_1g498 [Gonium pectorale]